MQDTRETDIQPLRDEAASVKGCFTEFSFQSLALSLGLLAVVFGATDTFPAAVYAPLPAIGLLMAVCRIAIFKYATANRNYGYELHLARTRHLERSLPSATTRWRAEYRRIDWEEALRAWRVVQPTIFRQIYLTPQTDRIARTLERSRLGAFNFFRPGLYRPTKKAQEVIDAYEATHRRGSEYPWFMPAVLVARASQSGGGIESVYYAGSYLQGILSALAVTQYLMLLPLLVTLVGRTSRRPVVDAAVMIVVALAIMLRHRRIMRRRVMLEDELQSIHSSAIVWQAVVICHYLALDDAPDFAHYTECLALRAQEVAKNVFQLHEWVKGEA